MSNALSGRARSDVSFRARVRGAVLHVLAAKAAPGLRRAPGVNTSCLALTDSNITPVESQLF